MNKNANEFLGAIASMALIFVVFFGGPHACRAYRTSRETKALEVMSHVSETVTDPDYFQALQTTLVDLTGQEVSVVQHTGTTYRVSIRTQKIGDLWDVTRPYTPLEQQYYDGQPATSDLGVRAAWDSTFLMSVTMTVAAARVGKIELIDCETLVRDESQNAAEYHATLVPWKRIIWH
jgi:hypothetical protein